MTSPMFWRVSLSLKNQAKTAFVGSMSMIIKNKNIMFRPSFNENEFRISGAINPTPDCPPKESPVAVLQRELKMLEQEEELIDNQILQIRAYLKDFIERAELAAYYHHTNPYTNISSYFNDSTHTHTHTLSLSNSLLKERGLSQSNTLIFIASSRYAYVQYKDIRELAGMEDQTIFAIKALPGTKLEVPDPDEVRIIIVVLRNSCVRMMIVDSLFQRK
jgi:hypothetical protein